ncbi:HD-GYP domain-containing protein [Paramaledivibacter caminithermalis]|jgi:putative nucleotidyltransferase with HDIG domain|uniref:HDIG domain-containing protein n=1 Tax=Paramaledivibacter caminithermalis (strain DSM 15212 / CIP 107654 / DViRD3) TaxID=1121301 RepID=A0A1M6SXX3_PARC5|nr:HD domain-containing phosphohydrolase [Paramaledivibacter caminithermalis]SHK49500.1 HDIG domain-containing protein [Paramaledivibacter caminithermalis DSM 15212]
MKENKVVNLYDFRHGLRVSINSYNIGERLSFNSNMMKNLYLSSLLHDIGKAHLDQMILNAPRKLNKNEFEHVKKHILYSVKEVRNLGFNEDIQNNIKYHHENYDGTGYLGLKGKEIPIVSRIIRICDTFDVLTNYRPYKNRMTVNEAFDEMEGKIKWYDEELYKIFKELIRNDNIHQLDISYINF